MEKTIAGKTIAVNEEGYLTDFSQWNEQVGEELAKEANINLTPRHCEVLKYLQKEVTLRLLMAAISSRVISFL